MNPKHLLQMSPVRSSKIPGPGRVWMTGGRGGSLATCFWVTSVQRCMKGYSFSQQRLSLLLYPFFGLAHFWFSFMGSLAGCEICFIFWLVEEAERKGAPSPWHRPSQGLGPQSLSASCEWWTEHVWMDRFGIQKGESECGRHEMEWGRIQALNY